MQNQKKHRFITENVCEMPNYQNPAFNVKLPIFSIHGNHDDLMGIDLRSSLDQLQKNNYLVYFGKVTNI